MARVLVLYASQDKQYADAFIRAARMREPTNEFDGRDNVGAFTLEADALAQYDALFGLLSPDALNSPAILRVLRAHSDGEKETLRLAILRPVTLPDFLDAADAINAEYLTPEQLAQALLAFPGAEKLPREQEESSQTTRSGLPYPDGQPSVPSAPPPPAAEQPPSVPYPEQPAAQPAPQPAPGAPPPHDARRRQRRETLQFSAYHPSESPVETWQTLLVYSHLAEQLSQIQADAGTFTELGSAPTVAQGQSQRKIPRNVEITVEPHMEGVIFSPAQESFLWRGEWHRSLFRYSGASALAGTQRRGWIDIYADRISPICTIEVTFSFHAGVLTASLSAPHGMNVTSNVFDTVFISYSHRDREPMRQARETYEKLGITAYHDDQLAAGENYERRLAEMIRAANVFHLLWSDASARSDEVRKEWLLALESQKGEQFIRPWYWQQPLVPPPEELQARKISFRYEHLRRKLLSPSTWL